MPNREPDVSFGSAKINAHRTRRFAPEILVDLVEALVIGIDLSSQGQAVFVELDASRFTE
jgi:hypothetical protein